MADGLIEAIERHMREFPDDAVLEWRDPKPRTSSQSRRALEVAVSDLVDASERTRRG